MTPTIVLFDSGRFPLWFRVPALAFGVVALWLGIEMAAYGLFGVNVVIRFANVRGSPLLGSLACFAIAALWIFVWFAHLRILLDAGRQELIVWTRGYFRGQERRISLAGCREVSVREIPHGLVGETWRVSVDYSDGRSVHVEDFPTGVEFLEQSLEAATTLPVKRYEDEA